MKTTPEIIHLLQQLQEQEGPAWQAGEAAVLKDYERAAANTGGVLVKILVVIGCILATLAFMAFLFVADLYRSEWFMALTGAGFVTTGILLSRKLSRVFLDTLSVTTYVAGAWMLTFGLTEMMRYTSASILLLITGLLSLYFIRQYVLALAATLTAGGALLAFIMEWHIPVLLHGYTGILVIALTAFMWQEARIITHSAWWNYRYAPIRLALILLLATCWLFTNFRYSLPAVRGQEALLSSGITIAAILYSLSRLLQILAIKRLGNRLLIMGITLLVLVPTVYAPAIAGALLVTLLCFAVSYRTGFVIGLVALVYAISQYYYDLQFTLFTKSILLVVPGALLLLLYLFVKTQLHPHEKK